LRFLVRVTVSEAPELKERRRHGRKRRKKFERANSSSSQVPFRRLTEFRLTAPKFLPGNFTLPPHKFLFVAQRRLQ
jgi:hypothetical protein